MTHDDAALVTDAVPVASTPVAAPAYGVAPPIEATPVVGHPAEGIPLEEPGLEVAPPAAPPLEVSSATPEFGPPPVDAIDAAALDRLFRTARTPSAWSPAPVAEETIRALYDLVKLGPTSGNCSPGRFVFLTTRDSRERLRPALSAGNVERTMSAAVTVIVAQDPMFFDNLPRLYPAEEARSWFAADHGLAEETAFRNATLQGGYLILAARALGLDAWPMSGFDSLKVDEIFLAGSGWRSNFLVNLGYADGAPATPRGPRLTFDEACMLL